MRSRLLMLLILGLPLVAIADWEKELNLYQIRDASGSDGIKFKCSFKELSASEEGLVDLKNYVSGITNLGNNSYLQDNFAKCDPAISCKPGQAYLTSTSYPQGFLDRSILEVSCNGVSVNNVFKEDKLSPVCWYPSPEPSSTPWAESSVSEDGVSRCGEGSYTDLSESDFTAKRVAGGKTFLAFKNANYFLIFNKEVAAGASYPIVKVASAKYYRQEYLSSDGSELSYELSLLNNDNIGVKEGASVVSNCSGSTGLCEEGALVPALGLNAFSSAVKFSLVLRNRSDASRQISEIFLNGLQLKVKQTGMANNFPTQQQDLVQVLASPDVMLRKKISLADFPNAKCEIEFSGKDQFDTVGGINIYKVQAEEIGLTPILTGLPDYLSYSKRSFTNWVGATFARNTAGVSVHDIEGNLKFLLKDQVYDVSASLSFVADPNSKIDCPMVKLKSPPLKNQISILPHSECGLFTAIRRYYLSDLANADIKLLYPGQEENQDYYLPLGRAPMIGLYNIGQRDEFVTPAIPGSTITQANEKQLEFNGLYPAISQLQDSARPGRYIDRYYKSTNIVARVFGEQGITRPILWAELGRDGKLKNALMEPTQGLENFDFNGISLKDLPDETLVVFEIIAKKDEYGREGAIVPGLFADNNVDSAKFDITHMEDRNIPFAGGSCLGSMPFYWPRKKVAQNFVEFPDPIKGANLCRYSIPYKLGDVRLGNAALTALVLTPKSAVDEYPVQLVMANKAPPACSVNNALNASGAPSSCWEIKSYMPPTVAENPITNHASCQERICNMYPRSSIIYYPCGSRTCSRQNNYQTEICYDRYKPSCQVLEKSPVDDEKECNQNMAFRFDGFFNQMTASLGCVAKYSQPANNVKIRNQSGEAVDLNGIEVSGSLIGQGIIPYSTSSISRFKGLNSAGYEQYQDYPMGGANPADYKSYPNAQKTKNRAENLGYACVPCQFNLPWLGNNSSAKNFDVTPLPLDQNSEDNPRIPKYVFNRKTMPASCVKQTQFEVRYFGSSQCTGSNNPSGSFCTSGNIQNRNCPSSEGGAGGNVAGKFSVNLCAGSEFGTNSVSASWSPILIDVKGRGIQVSRESILAVDFDMEGKGKKMLVDWPLNTMDVGILVEPDKKGRVTSIKQLFGDDKFKNGFEKLKKLDSNKDKLLNIKDKSFAKLKLWFDRNRNAIAEQTELESLIDHGVTQINFNYVSAHADGINSLSLSSTYFNSNEKKYMNIVDVYFHGYMYRNGPAISYRQQASSK